MMTNFYPRSVIPRVALAGLKFGLSWTAGWLALIAGYGFFGSLGYTALSVVADEQTAARVVVPIGVMLTCWHISNPQVIGLGLSVAARLHLVFWLYVITLVSMIDSYAGGFVFGSLLGYPLVIAGDKLLRYSGGFSNAKTHQVSMVEIETPAAPAETDNNPLQSAGGN